MWNVTVEVKNCGKDSCLKGCVDEDGNKTDATPHGPFATLQRRRKQSEMETAFVHKIHERFRIGTWKPDPRAIKLINKHFDVPWNYEFLKTSRERRLFYRELRTKIYNMLLENGYKHGRIHGMLPK